MHLFLIGLNLDQDFRSRALSGFKDLPEIFSTLADGEKHIFYREQGFVISLSSTLHSSKLYYNEDQNFITMINGLPIDAEDKIEAYNAKQTAADFVRIKTSFEGQGSLIRINKNNFDIQLVTDIVGMEQIYYYSFNSSLIISNRISLISETLNSNCLDPYGVSYFITLGWAASDRTLQNEIKVIPGGQHWVWSSSKNELQKFVYNDFSQIRTENKNISKLKISSNLQLPKIFMNRLQQINRNFELECPLTGGFDSRVIAGLLIKSNINAKYYTSGDDASEDVQIAKIIADRFNLNHVVFNVNDDDLISNWDKLIKQFILQNDGMIPLWQLADIFTNTDSAGPRKVRLAAHGATTGKVIYDEINLRFPDLNKKDLIHYFVTRLIPDHHSLIKESAIQNAKKYLIDFVEDSISRGIEVRDIPGYFFLVERLRRNHGNNWNKTREIADTFDVFCSREYLNVALTLNALQKSTYPLHYWLYKSLHRDLLKIRFTQNRKPGYQNAALMFYLKDLKKHLKTILLHNSILSAPIKKRVADKSNQFPPVFNQLYWFEKKLPEIKALLLDSQSSDLWLYLNKSNVESTLSDSSLYSKNGVIDKLFIIISLFYYENLIKHKSHSSYIDNLRGWDVRNSER